MPSSHYSTVLHKRNATSGAVPSLSSLSAGEIAMNESDGKLFIRTVNDSIETFLNEKQIPYLLNANLSAVIPQYGNNEVSQVLSNVLGGYGNNIGGAASVIVNGELNSLLGDFGFIGSGTQNIITSAGDFSAILGGHHNLVSHANSFVLGSYLSSHAENFTYVNNISGTYYGDGSNLTGIVTSIGSYLALSGGTLTGGITGTNAVFTSVSAVTIAGDGSLITGLTLGQIGVVSGGSILNQFVGDGSTKTYLIDGYNTLDQGGYLVSVGGIDQPSSFWNVSASNGGQITFTEAPKNGEIISVRVLRGVIVGSTGIPAVYSSISADVFLGDGSGLTNLTIGSYLSSGGGTLTGGLTGTNATFTSVSAARFYGDGSSLTGLTIGNYLSSGGGTLTGGLTGTGANFSEPVYGSTATAGVSTTQLANTAFVHDALAAGTAVAGTVIAFVTNADSVPLTRGTVVYSYGAQGDRVSVRMASASAEATSSKTLGFVNETIAVGGTGYVTLYGAMDKLNFGAPYVAGDALYLGTIPGTYTRVKPQAPVHSVYLGVVQRANNGNGTAYIKVQNGYELNEIHDVLITTPLSSQILQRNESNTLWVNQTPLFGDAQIASSNKWNSVYTTVNTISSTQYLPLTGGVVTGSIQADSITDTHGGTLVKKKSFKIIGDGTSSQFTLDHNFNTYDTLIQVYEYNTKETVMCYSKNISLSSTLIDVGSTLNAEVTGFLVVIFS